MAHPSTSWGFGTPPATTPAGSSGLPVKKIADHAVDAIKRLPFQHRDKTTITALLTALATPANAIETAFCQLLDERDIDNAAGDQLDVIGRVVGEARNGRSDDDYRRFVRARVATNRSSGTVEEILNIMDLVLNDSAATIVNNQFFPAAFHIVVQDAAVTDTIAEIAAQFALEASADGVRVIVETAEDVDAEMMTFPLECTFADGIIAALSTTINVDDTSDFPATGTVKLSEGLAVEEDFTYTSKTATSFTGAVGTANAHEDNAAVVLTTSVGKGLGDDAVPATGGKFANATQGVE